MEFKIGKVYSYDNKLGKIVTDNDEYLFNEDDIESESINKGDLVQFRPEVINDINRAFFVSKTNNINYNNDEVIKKVMKNGKQ